MCEFTGITRFTEAHFEVLQEFVQVILYVAQILDRLQGEDTAYNIVFLPTLKVLKQRDQWWSAVKAVQRGGGLEGQR